MVVVFVFGGGAWFLNHRNPNEPLWNPPQQSTGPSWNPGGTPGYQPTYNNGVPSSDPGPFHENDSNVQSQIQSFESQIKTESDLIHKDDNDQIFERDDQKKRAFLDDMERRRQTIAYYQNQIQQLRITGSRSGR